MRKVGGPRTGLPPYSSPPGCDLHGFSTQYSNAPSGAVDYSTTLTGGKPERAIDHECDVPRKRSMAFPTSRNTRGNRTRVGGFLSTSPLHAHQSHLTSGRGRRPIVWSHARLRWCEDRIGWRDSRGHACPGRSLCRREAAASGQTPRPGRAQAPRPLHRQWKACGRCRERSWRLLL